MLSIVRALDTLCCLWTGRQSTILAIRDLTGATVTRATRLTGRGAGIVACGGTAACFTVAAVVVIAIGAIGIGIIRGSRRLA